MGMGTKKGLPLAAMERLLRDYTGLRVSEGAKQALKTGLETYVEAIAQKSARLAQHAGRKTIKGEDIKLALKE
jgi:DNA-binding protein